MRTFLLALVAFLFATPAFAATAPCPAGLLVKGSTDAVYYCGVDGKRYVFPSSAVYFTWYPDFSTVVKISDSLLASVRLGGNVTVRPGTRLVKIVSDPKVYAVDGGGTLRWITSEAVAAELYGADWNKKVDDISDAFFTDYKTGAPIGVDADFAPAVATLAASNIWNDKLVILNAPPPEEPVATSTPPVATPTPPVVPPPAPPPTPTPAGFTGVVPSDAPGGPSSGSAEQLVGKFVFTSAGGATLAIKAMNVTINSTISNTAPRMVRIYRDQVSPGTLLGATTTCVDPITICNFGATAFQVGDVPSTDVGSGAPRLFLVTADTSDAQTGNALTVTLPQGGLHWSDGVTQDITIFDSLPLSGKTLRY